MHGVPMRPECVTFSKSPKSPQPVSRQPVAPGGVRGALRLLKSLRSANLRHLCVSALKI
jgi:hypothetical protein